MLSYQLEYQFQEVQWELTFKKTGRIRGKREMKNRSVVGNLNEADKLGLSKRKKKKNVRKGLCTPD